MIYGGIVRGGFEDAIKQDQGSMSGEARLQDAIRRNCRSRPNVSLPFQIQPNSRPHTLPALIAPLITKRETRQDFSAETPAWAFISGTTRRDEEKVAMGISKGRDDGPPTVS